ncbi:MAG: flagellar biosynthesis anti-sigma factor FlgM [Bdellovibrionales bacterium]|nr:flagellar biosynthesis anti-sigma factor FlgM [Bdellovibrionales bacterium]
MKVSGKAARLMQQTQAQSDLKNLKSKKMDAQGMSKMPMLESAQVNLSDRAQQIKRATDIASNDSVDEAKIAKFQKLIDSGKYNIDAEKIADKLVDEHLKFPS